MKSELDVKGQRIMASVRDATNSLHQGLDDHIGGQGIMAGEIERDFYVRMLRAHLALHKIVARHIAAAETAGGPQFLDWPECERLPALSQDLNRLSAEQEMHEASLPDVPVEGVAVATGLLYVVEGACHGTGQMLRALNTNPEFVSWSADAFMRVSKKSVSKRWASTLKLVKSQGEVDLTGVISGAASGYTYFRAAWDRYGSG